MNRTKGPHAHVPGIVLEDISGLMPYLEMVLDVFLTPDDDEILIFP